MTTQALKVHWLKSWPADSSGALPYGGQRMRQNGIALTSNESAFAWMDRYASLRRWGAPRLHGPGLQTFLSWPAICRSDVVLAMFESEGHVLALLRRWRVPGARRPRLVVFVCWLAEELRRAPARRKARLQVLYREVDHILCLSANQVPLLARDLGFPAERITSLAFGVDTECFRPDEAAVEADWLLSVGRDRGRDWVTLFAALEKSGLPCKIICRPADIAGLAVPGNVEVLGTVSRSTYRRLLGEARAVILATRELAYPTGQSVLLEALSMGKACLVTETPAMRDYLKPGETVLVAPVGDSHALAEQMQRLHQDQTLRQRLSRQARKCAMRNYDQKAMWDVISGTLLALGTP